MKESEHLEKLVCNKYSITVKRKGKMSKQELINKLTAIGYKYTPIMGDNRIMLIFNYINFANSLPVDDVPVNPAISEILETYEI